jgi:Swt1-like HEPN
MEISNPELVGRLLDEVKRGLRPFLEPILADRLGNDWRMVVRDRTLLRIDSDPLEDAAAALAVMDRYWKELFPRGPLTPMERSHVNELLEWRHRWAHAEPIDEQDVHRVMLTAERLLGAIGRSPAVDKGLKQYILRVLASRDHRGSVSAAADAIANVHAPSNTPKDSRSDAAVVSRGEAPNGLKVEDRQGKAPGFLLVVKPQYEEQDDRFAKKWGLPDIVDMFDKRLDMLALVAQIVIGVQNAIQSGDLVKGDKISPSQVVLPPEANPDLTILAFSNLERDGVLEKEQLGIPVWLVR